MFSKIAFFLAAVTLAQAQFQTIGAGGVRLIPVGSYGASYGGLAGIGGYSAAPASSYYLSGGAAPSSVQIVPQQAASIRYVAAPQPQTIRIAAPQPQTISIAAPQPQIVRYAAPAPQPQTIRVAAPAPAPRQQIHYSAPAVETDYEEPGSPVAQYNFAFDETDEYGMNLKRAEGVDGNGWVSGSYSFTTPEGYSRVVNYISDEKGFRAEVQTNEPGTASSQPADALYSSSAQ